MLQQDPRNYQILFLSLFLILGIGTRDWTLRPDLILVVTITCLLTQWIAVSLWPNPQEKIMTWLKAKEMESWKEKLKLGRLNVKSCNSQIRLPLLIASPNQGQNSSEKENLSLVSFSQVTSLKSAMITSLSLSLLLRADHYTTMILAGSLAILSKFLFQFERKHFFNPANFGIIAALLLTHDAWVSPGQWGENGWYALLFAGTGGLVLKRVGRWDTTVAFLGAYTLLEAIRNLWLGWTWDVLSHRLMSGSLLLFALFMITDPRSIPNARISRILWAGCLAILTFILRNQFFISTSFFWALFALSPFILILDLLWSSSMFSWNETYANNEVGLVNKEANQSKLEPLSFS